MPFTGGDKMKEAMDLVRNEFKAYQEVAGKIHEGAQRGQEVAND